MKRGLNFVAVGSISDAVSKGSILFFVNNACIVSCQTLHASFQKCLLGRVFPNFNLLAASIHVLY